MIEVGTDPVRPLPLIEIALKRHKRPCIPLSDGQSVIPTSAPTAQARTSRCLLHTSSRTTPSHKDRTMSTTSSTNPGRYPSTYTDRSTLTFALRELWLPRDRRRAHTRQRPIGTLSSTRCRHSSSVCATATPRRLLPPCPPAMPNTYVTTRDKRNTAMK